MLTDVLQFGGLLRRSVEHGLDPPAIVVFPQCPANERWAGAAWKIAIAALDQTEREFSIDPQRVSLTGMSMGGAGVWVLAAQYPKRWSAIANGWFQFTIARRLARARESQARWSWSS